jgi:hypothetical protein
MMNLREALRRILDKAIENRGTPKGRSASQLAVWLHQLQRVLDIIYRLDINDEDKVLMIQGIVRQHEVANDFKETSYVTRRRIEQLRQDADRRSADFQTQRTQLELPPCPRATHG